MRKGLARLVTVLLLPCLIADRNWASTNCFSQSTAVSFRVLQEAIVPSLIGSMNEPINPGSAPESYSLRQEANPTSRNSSAAPAHEEWSEETLDRELALAYGVEK